MFAELSATSNFTFLTGASHPEEYARRAAELGLGAIAIADVNSVAGVVRAHQALKELRRVGEAAIRESRNVGHADVVATSDASPPTAKTRKIWIKTKPVDAQPDRP